MTMNYGLMDFVGNIGVLMLMFTYLALQLDKIKSADLSYSVLNAVGASLIVASLIVERLGRPAVLMSIGPDGRAKGSARSIPCFDLLEGQRACYEHWEARFIE